MSWTSWWKVNQNASIQLSWVVLGSAFAAHTGILTAFFGWIGTAGNPSSVASTHLPIVLAIGFAGLVRSEDTGSAIARLTNEIERARSGTGRGNFTTDRTDEIGALYEAVDGLVSAFGDCVAPYDEDTEHTEDCLNSESGILYSFDEEGNLLQWTEGLSSLSGYSEADLSSMTAFDFFDEADLPSVVNAVERARETGRASVDVEVVTRDDEHVRTALTAVKIGTTGEYQIVAELDRHDGDRERLERELRTEKEHFRVALENSPLIAFRLDTDLRYTWVCNPHPDFRPEDALGKRDDELLPTEQAEKIMAPKRAVLETGKGIREEVSYELPSGRVSYELTVEPLRDDSGTIVGLTCSSLDITGRKERERELKRTSDLFRRTQRIAGVGGWELDLDTDPPYEVTMTDEVYRIHEVPVGEPFDLEKGIEFYHPDDRPRIRAAIERAIETGERYELEARLITAEDNERWVTVAGEGIERNGEIVSLQGTFQDVTEQKEREFALSSLHETARELLNTETASDVADVVVGTTEDVLDVDGVGVYYLTDTNEFEPIASTDGFDARSEDPPTVSVGDTDSPIWNTFATETHTVFEDDGTYERSLPFDEDVTGGLLVPIGDYGVFVALAPPSTIDHETRRLVETIAATTEAAFDRLESQRTLRERDAELEARNRRLKRQIQITEIIRSIDQSLIGATTHEEIELSVCQQLVETDDIGFAWIGNLNPTESTLQPRAWAGGKEEYLDIAPLEADLASPEPSVITARTDRSTVVSNILDDLKTESWRKSALAYGFSSCLYVPITFDEYSYGVLSVYADEPGVFDRLERTVFEELGEGIANSITTVKTRQALHADTLLELTLRFNDPETFLARVARKTGDQIDYEGLTTRSADETRLFFSTSGGNSDSVSQVLEDLVSVRSYKLIDESSGRCLFEATVAGDHIASRLVRHGANPRSIRATPTGLEVVVDVSPTINVREFVGMLDERYSSVELVARRDVRRSMHTREELVASLFEELTDRQLEALETAYYAGFFDWPRKSTGEDIADMLGVAQPTVNRHLRFGQQRLLTQLFEPDEHPAVR
ncbi:bacterio-opsin activator domain-containing protein [Natrinema gelatinilyticum]|uniref:bacterio-opsin activator domain-containing protein n=1 Tax=Natrinema gelatinilyticum TaxID=2961571 RepID=UPI0020C2FC01|nr:bacterio-opsin activator domain-containing protein [Natrinema gelatinilyticum]